MRCTVAVLFLLAVPAIAQKNTREVIKTVDDYCIAISKKVDAMDDTEGDTLLSDLPEADRAKVAEYLTTLSALRGTIRHDACDGKDLKFARVATRRDMKKHAALTDEMLAYAHKAMAEAYRKKTQSGKNSKKLAIHTTQRLTAHTLKLLSAGRGVVSIRLLLLRNSHTRPTKCASQHKLCR